MRKLRFARAAAAAMMAHLLVAPTSAIAATRIKVTDTIYEGGNAASGEGWTWDGADNMGLNGYDGGCIYAVGDLVVTLEGENKITQPEQYGPSEDFGIGTYRGSLTVQGEGSLDVKSRSYGLAGPDGLTIDGVNVSIDAVIGTYCDDGHTTAIKNGADVTVAYTGDEKEAYGLLNWGDIVIDGSRILVDPPASATEKCGVAAIDHDSKPRQRGPPALGPRPYRLQGECRAERACEPHDPLCLRGWVRGGADSGGVHLVHTCRLALQR